MKLLNTVDSIRRELKKHKVRGKSIGFVPTMGALHEGHLRLIRQAAKENNIVVVSIFVNPIQFGPKEDLKKYPRTLKKDLAICRKFGVDFVFTPSVKEIYPNGFSTYVFVEGLSNILCGASRPGHFQGVATVVTKLLNIIQPVTLYLGQKDAQQAVIIKRMIVDLNIPVRIKIIPTVRRIDGLALSSRNKYLNNHESIDASVLSRALNLARVLIKNGARDSLRIISRMKQLILQKKAKIDYISIVDANNLSPLKVVSGDCLIVLAVRFGKVRLIDNVIIRIT
ncbi:MAG: pantoate--beta-alanine ligase [Candidatus Omnitrophica bacterium]|nr:pantoate--beta-alanine ligase [Candidatus Omnitrophota bacterium]